MKKTNLIIAGIAMALALPFAVKAQVDISELPTTMISEAPEGEATAYTRTCDYFYTNNYRYLQGTNYGSAMTMVEGTDGNVYIFDVISSRALPGWIKGERQGNDIVISFPQLVSQENGVNVWADKGALIEYVDKDGLDRVKSEVCADRTLTLVGDGEGNYTFKEADAEGRPVGIVLFFIDKNGEYAYNDNADVNLRYSPMTDVAATVPEGLETTKCGMVYNNGNTCFVDVAFDDANKKVYVLNLRGSLSAIGDIVGDKVEFNPGIYLGMSGNVYVYQGASAWIDNSLERRDKVVFSYSADTHTLVADDNGCILMERGNGTGSILEQFLHPYIQPQDDYVVGVPLDPVKVRLITGTQEFSQLYVNIVCATLDYKLIDPKKVYYSLYLEDDVDPMYFMKNEYICLDKNTDRIPYVYSDNWDFYNLGATKYMFLYQYVEKVGFQTIVVDGDGKEYISNISYSTPSSSVETPQVEAKEVQDVVFYDLQGCRVNSPSSGIFIRQTIYTDGSRESSKHIIR